jgi:predicted nucleic acid-binding protein
VGLETARPAPLLVLDTNAVLDAWLFKDPGAQALVAAIETGQVQWLACAAMRDELARAAQFRSLASWKPDSVHLLTCFDRWAQLCPAPVATEVPRLRCTDPDDQVFIDLALHVQATWLLTHDSAVLKLAKRARLLGLVVTTPALWAIHAGPAGLVGPAAV